MDNSQSLIGLFDSIHLHNCQLLVDLLILYFLLALCNEQLVHRLEHNFPPNTEEIVLTSEHNFILIFPFLF